MTEVKSRNHRKISKKTALVTQNTSLPCRNQRHSHVGASRPSRNVLTNSHEDLFQCLCWHAPIRTQLE
ncbi:hypothetical protein HYC85_004368 [Camellia sinensis]|uniref:Uncharacterized protein n=1 Tax=Camellia sinensis TaxID=4442 RepID=A0A7J7HWC2_CAMSI|nr:hypothetical protein HYC85_004368 [Camellia sinensis]